MNRATYTIERRGVKITAEFRGWSSVHRSVCYVRLHIEGSTKKTIRDCELCRMCGPVGDEPLAFGVYTLRPRLPSRWQRQGIDVAWGCALEQKLAEEKAERERAGASLWGETGEVEG